MEQVLQISFSLTLSLHTPISMNPNRLDSLPGLLPFLSLFCVGHLFMSLPLPFPAWTKAKQPDCHCTTLYVIHSNHWAHRAHANTIGKARQGKAHTEADMHTWHFRQMLFLRLVWSVLLSPLQTSHILDEAITRALNALLRIPLYTTASGKRKHKTFIAAYVYGCTCVLWELWHMFQTHLAFQQFPLKVAIVYIPNEHYIAHL